MTPKLSELNETKGWKINLDLVQRQLVLTNKDDVSIRVPFAMILDGEGVTPIQNDMHGNNDAYMAMLSDHEDLCQLLSVTKDKELDLRLKLFNGAFPNPKEGTNTWKLPDGRELKGKYVINRYVNQEVLQPTLQALREHGVANTDQLVKFKPELAKREWNALSDEAKLIFSPAITATPGTPQFEVVTPKRARR